MFDFKSNHFVLAMKRYIKDEKSYFWL